MINTSEFLNGRFFIKAEYLFPYITRLISEVKGIAFVDKEKEPLKANYYGEDLAQFQTEQLAETKASNVAVINITGVMTKFGTWYDYGAYDYAALLTEAYRDESVKAIILKWHTPGGSDGAMITLKAALLKRNKPVISVIDNMCMSAGVYCMQFTDAVYAVDEMASIGSIGVMTSFTNWDKYYAAQDLEIHEIYPPESNWKNKAQREAKKGNFTVIIEEVLSPWAKHFQQTVIDNSPNLDQGVEGVIAGREFYAYDAVKNGLIKAIMPMDDVIQMAFDYTENELKKLFNN